MRLTEFHQSCPHCGGPAFSDLILAEKKDACYHKVKASAKVWPSAYASGRLVQCRKKGAANYGNKSEGVAEGSDPASAKFGKYIKQYFDQIYEYGDDGLNYLDNNAPFWASLFDKHNGDIDDIIAMEPADVLKQAALELKDVAGDLKYELDEQGVTEAQLDEKCWDGYQQQGMKNKGGRQVPNCVATEGVEGPDPGILFYAKIPDGSRVYARVKDEEQIARLQQQYRAAEIKTFDFRRPDILDWLEARGINLRKFAPGMVQTMYPGSRGHNESKGLNEFAPGAGGDDEAGDDPYKYPKPKRYNRSADYFGQFEADHFEREDFDDATGVFKGYWGGKQIAYFKFDNSARTGSDDPGRGWYYEPQSGGSDNTTAGPADDNADERKQQELDMISQFLKSGNRPNPDSQIGQLMKKYGMLDDLNEFAMSGSDDDGNDGFSDDTLKQLAAQWYNGDEDPRVEQTLAAAGWEIGQDEGYDDTPGVFVVQAGDINGNSYISWPAHELEGLAETVDPEIEEMYQAMEQLAEEMAARKGVSVDLVWESFEALDDHMLYETAAWRRKEGKSKKGGLNAKGVASYRRENPGSKLQMAVTTKPSKLKKGSKAAKRRKSFCARMGGVKGPMKKPNGKPTRKALALRKWNC